MHSIADYLRRWQTQQGYSQQRMADFLMVHRTTYTKYETSVTDPPLDILCRMADVLGCTVDTLLGRG